MAPTIEPIEERIEAAIAAHLDTIATGPGYYTTPVVTRELLAIDQYKDADLVAGLLGVMRTSGSTLEIDELDIAPLHLHHQHRIAVWGYVTRAGGVIAGTLLNRLFADHLRCLMANRTLAGLVDDLRPVPAPRDSDDGAREPKAFFRQHWVARVIEDF